MREFWTRIAAKGRKEADETKLLRGNIDSLSTASMIFFFRPSDGVALLRRITERLHQTSSANSESATPSSPADHDLV